MSVTAYDSSCFLRPAMEKWGDLEYIKAAAGDRTVPVETGSNYTASDWGQKLMTVGEFITNHVEERVAARGGREEDGGGGGASDSNKDGKDGTQSGNGQQVAQTPPPASKPGAYLAQHQLFDQVPELADDIVIPDYCTCMV